jgi:succinyl-diaminopimelate desuccinylase
MIEALLERIAGRRGELVELTRELIRFPTVNPPGEAYEPCARHLGERLARAGFEVQYLRAVGAIGDSERFPRINLVARREGGRPGPCVHFNGHLDVVETGHGWTLNAFAGVVRDGRLYGRGAADMKGGIAAAVIALESLIEAGIDLPGAIELSGTADEESGGFAGVAWLAERGFFSHPRVDHVIIPEPLDVDRVCIGHRGVWWAEVETLGRSAHGAMPFLGTCAIRHMGAFLGRLERQLLPRLAARYTAMPVVPAEARHSTLNVASLHGGMPAQIDGLPSPMVADRCRMLLDRRFLLEEDPAEVRAEVVAILDQLAHDRPGFAYRISDVMQVLPTETARDAEIVQAVAASIRRVLGRPAQLVASPGTYDHKHVARIGGLASCIAYGPGILDLAHQPDEYVVIDDLVASAQVMAVATLRLLGVEAR